MAVLSKILLKKDIVHDLGCKYDDAYAVALKEIARADAAKQAYLVAQQKVEALCQGVQEDLEDGTLEKALNKGAPVLAEYVKRWLMRAGGACDNLATAAKMQELRAEGAASTWKAIVDATKKDYDRTMVQLQAIHDAMEDDAADVDPVTGDVSVRPGGAQASAAEDIANRRAEAKAAKEAKEEAPKEEAKPDAKKPAAKKAKPKPKKSK